MHKQDTRLRRAAIARALRRLSGPAHQKTIARRAKRVDESELSKYLNEDRLAGERKLRQLARGLEVSYPRLWQEIARAEVELAAEADQAEVTEPLPPYPAPPEEIGTLDRALRSVVVDSLRETLPALLDQELSQRGLPKLPRE